MFTRPLNFHEFLPVKLLGSCSSTGKAYRTEQLAGVVLACTHRRESVGFSVLAPDQEAGRVSDKEPLEVWRVGRHLA